ncbi:cytochrome P450 [Pluteus cervinus]|uniref:Cytochrome P450 n=1 Tax=Pluteus cervinus TaxID=181527 RepID=A0ACD3AL11_9AGAR|nr:cytochrome P450 [Pluteus cervinus]
MLDLSPTIWALVGLFLVVYCIPSYIRAVRSPINRIPTIGPSGVFASYYGALKALWSSNEMIQEGYEKYYGGTFKIPMMDRWSVVVSGPELYDEFRRRPDDELSFHEATNETLQMEFTFGKGVKEVPYHTGTIRTPLTRNLANRFPDIQDEIAASFAEHVPAKEDEWLSLPTYDTILQIVVRTSNRLFVGLPLCRNPDFGKLNIGYTREVFKAAFILQQFPAFLRPFFAKLFTNIDTNVNRAIRHLGPMIEERLAREKQLGSEDPERPNDLISWLLDYATPGLRTVYDLTTRVLTINFAAIHTTSMTFTHILYDLASHPEYAEPLRQELATVLVGDDWSKVAMTKLRKLDSFIKESQRLSGSNALIMTRLVMKDITLSDGSVVPKGNFISIASRALHLDERIYPDPNEFQGFRFSDMRDGEGEGTKHQAVTLGSDWTTFGGGRHACPGRFFAVNEVKAMLAYVLLNYDVKLKGGERPKTTWLGPINIPNQTAHLLFRKRKQQ